MSRERKIAVAARRRALRVRAKLTAMVPRASIFRSLNHIYVQIIDDQTQKTLVSFSSLVLQKKKGDKKEIAFAVGKELAQKARAQGIAKVVFDRGQFLYHGRVKSLAEGLREGGLEI